jgi:peroxiredoxin 2/4
MKDDCEEKKATGMPMIGDTAPAFYAITTQGEINFPGDYSDKWVILFSFVMDFSPVCTTELMTLASMKEEFEKIDVEIIGLSIASVYSHIAWVRKMKELVWKDMKHIEITFPLIADISTEVVDKYALQHSNVSKAQSVRAVFIIDPEAKIRAILYYPKMVGRNIKEIRRLVMALQETDCGNAETPADWMPGDDVILPPPSTCNSATERMNKVNENMYCLDWFLVFRQSDCSAYSPESEPEINPFPSALLEERKKIIRK